MILAIVIGCTQALWQALRRNQMIRGRAMADDLWRECQWEMAKTRFRNVEVARKWWDWNEARPKPRLRDHFVRLWRTLRKGRK